MNLAQLTLFELNCYSNFLFTKLYQIDCQIKNHEFIPALKEFDEKKICGMKVRFTSEHHEASRLFL